jgi:hypothetical protein
MFLSINSYDFINSYDGERWNNINLQLIRSFSFPTRNFSNFLSSVKGKLILFSCLTTLSFSLCGHSLDHTPQACTLVKPLLLLVSSLTPIANHYQSRLQVEWTLDNPHPPGYCYERGSPSHPTRKARCGHNCH